MQFVAGKFQHQNVISLWILFIDHCFELSSIISAHFQGRFIIITDCNYGSIEKKRGNLIKIMHSQYVARRRRKSKINNDYADEWCNKVIPRKLKLSLQMPLISCRCPFIALHIEMCTCCAWIINVNCWSFMVVRCGWLANKWDLSW